MLKFGTVSLSLALLSAIASNGFAEEKLEYNRDIRPILSENCFACHGADSAARKADLRLDDRKEAIEAEAIVPGKPDESNLIERILLSEDDPGLMPPKKSRKSLTAAQKELLKQWVRQGAEYQAHWSFITPQRPTLPEVKQADWVRTPIDAFILAKLEQQNLKPAPEADRRTLARRLSFDLTGLPPEPADVEEFVNDKSPNYYEKYVDKLLASPHWGEHRGRYWLDAARYADTHGIHFDNFREIWAYRDWVINAYNQNMSFDQFTIEQLAGDLLPNPTLDQKIATGFNRCNITTNEGGIIDEEYAVLYARDRTETTSTVWMGLTVGCAVCHDHKYDPVSMKEFYSLSAFFNNTTQPVRDGNVPNTPPIIPVPLPEDRQRLTQLQAELAKANQAVKKREQSAKPDFEKWLAQAKPEDVQGQVPADGLALHAPFNEGQGEKAKLQVAGQEREIDIPKGYAWTTERAGRKTLTIKPGPAIEFPEVGDFDMSQPFAVSTWVWLGKRGANGSIVARMDEGSAHRGWDLWLQADRIGMHLIHSWSDNALKVVDKTPLPLREWSHVCITYDGSAKSSGVKIFVNGEPRPFTIEADKLKSTTKANVPLKIGQRNGSSRVDAVSIQDLRIYSRKLSGLDAKALAGNQRTAELVAKPADKRTKEEVAELFAWWLGNLDEASKKLNAERDQLQAEETAIRSRGTIAHIMTEKPGEPIAHILNRGEYDQRLDQVAAATPAALPSMPEGQPVNRLGLAHWLLSPEHPLTTRVTVNRFWQELFGTGLVRTADDFGITGELPSHPELLDWLAVEFREKGWDIKDFYKLIVSSAAYRQAAVTTPEKLEKDPDNRLLSRGPRFRMDAEMVRDNALAVSGLLVRKLGGPSVKPYQPDGVWEAVAMIGSNTRNYKRDSGENLYRRSLYTFWKRSAPPAFLDVMNAPNRETCTVVRDRTNTPLQALLTLNDVQYVEAARVLASEALKDGCPTDESKIDFLARRLLSRPFSSQELDIVQKSLADLVDHYREKPNEESVRLITYGESKPDPELEPTLLAAWTMLVNQLMNLDEVLNK